MAAQSATREIELKLEPSEDGMAVLVRSRLLGRSEGTKDLRAVYYDTPDHALAKAGLTLRIRESGGRRVQTIKTDGGSAGLFDRDEWELDVTGEGPVPDVRAPIGKLLDGRFDALLPVFDVPVTRKVSRAGGIEVALDRGEAVAGERPEAIREIELELVEGEAADLFGLARRIDARTPVRIGVLSKSERGYRLLSERPASVHAAKVALDPDMAPADAFARIAHQCLRQYRLNEDMLLDRPNPDAVHQARVALRRLRSAMTLFKDLLGETRRPLSDRLRDLAKVLGEARDLDVLAQAVAPGPLHRKLEAARRKAYVTMSAELARPETRRLPLDLVEWLAIGAWRDDPETARLRETPLRVFAAKALDRLRRKLKTHGRKLGKLDPEHRHRVRKDAKKLRYAVDFLATLFADEEKRRKRFLKALKQLQEALGGLNDGVAARERLTALRLTGMAEAEAFLGAREADADGLLNAAVEARHALLAAKPFWDA